MKHTLSCCAILACSVSIRKTRSGKIDESNLFSNLRALGRYMHAAHPLLHHPLVLRAGIWLGRRPYYPDDLGSSLVRVAQGSTSGMRTSVSFLLVVVALSGCTSNIQRKTFYAPGQVQYDSRVALLDRLKHEKKYDELMLVLFPDFRKTGLVPVINKEENEVDFFWLRQETARPPPGKVDFPLFYFFSWKLAFADVRNSRFMNARGRIGLMLDSGFCRNSRASTPWIALVEGGVFNNMKLREDRAWYDAVNAALNWHGTIVDSTDNKEWFCGAQNTLPSSEIAARHFEMIKKIRQVNSEKLSRQGL